MNTPNNSPDKGELNGSCNITSCQKPNSATWYNHSTQKHYCEECANRLNNDEFNKRDAMRLFGHDLCTKVEVSKPVRKTAEEIIDFVVDHFTKNPRALYKTSSSSKEVSQCAYITPDGKRCGHSICLTDEALESLTIEDNITSSANCVISAKGDNIHKEEFRGQTIKFWSDIQFLHDKDLNWNGNVLSREGCLYVEYLKREYKNH